MSVQHPRSVLRPAVLGSSKFDAIVNVMNSYTEGVLMEQRSNQAKALPRGLDVLWS